MENLITHKPAQLNSSWFIEEPIDLEHKIYKLSSFLFSIKENIDKGYWFPSFLILEERVKDLESFLESSNLINSNKNDKNLLDYVYNLPKDSSDFIKIMDIANYSYQILSNLYFSLLDELNLILDDMSIIDKIKDKRVNPIYFIEKCGTCVIEKYKVGKNITNLGSFHSMDYKFLFNEENYIQIITSYNISSEFFIIPVVRNLLSLEDFP